MPDAPHPPSLIVTGATASSRGSARFGPFAAGKFAVRGLSQSLSREFHPQGVHVAHVIIDAVIDTPRTKAYNVGNGAPDAKLSPDVVRMPDPWHYYGVSRPMLTYGHIQIADEYWHLHTQHRSGFTEELALRPYVEKF